jgi:transcriptional regulator with XRE-family HTH domain
MPGIYDRIAQRVREERKRRGFSLEELAERADLTASFLGQIERGERKLSVDALDRIAQALNVPVGALWGESAKSKAAPAIESRIADLVRHQPEEWKLVALKTLKFFLRASRRQSSR